MICNYGSILKMRFMIVINDSRVVLEPIFVSMIINYDHIVVIFYHRVIIRLIIVVNSNVLEISLKAFAFVS